MPTGWSLLEMVKLQQRTEAGTPGPATLPFAAVLGNAAAKQVVVAIRGTQTNSEWMSSR